MYSYRETSTLHEYIEEICEKQTRTLLKFINNAEQFFSSLLSAMLFYIIQFGDCPTAIHWRTQQNAI